MEHGLLLSEYSCKPRNVKKAQHIYLSEYMDDRFSKRSFAACMELRTMTGFPNIWR